MTHFWSAFSLARSTLLAVAFVNGAAFGAPAAPTQPAQVQSAADPRHVVEHFHDTLIRAMHKGGKAAFDARYAMLDPVIRRTFDLPYIGKAVLGPYWSKLNPEQQKTFLEHFARNTAATYAGRFNLYSGERFATLNEQTLQPNLRVVDTQLTESGGKTHRFSYLLRRTTEGWQVVNVLVDRISNIAVQRSEYTAILRDKGFDGLIARLDAMTKSMRESS